MKRETAKIAELRLPPEDGTISRALDDLKGKLSEWIETVATVQSKIAARADQCLEAATAAVATANRRDKPAQNPPQPEQGDVQDQDQRQHPHTLSSDNDDDASRNMSQSISTSIPAQENESPSPSSDVESNENTDALRILRKAMSSETASEGNSVEADVVEEMEGDDPAQSAISESEALLHSLEPEMAKIIRVQHRLFNGRKSIQELIDEYEKTPAPQKPKSWWERIKK